MERNSKLLRILAASLTAAALAACGGPEDRKTTYIKRGTALYETADYHKARLEFKNALHIDPQDIRARYLLAQVLEKLQNWPGAVEHYQHVLELEPSHVGARVQLGQLYLASPDKAKKMAEEVLKYEPNNPDALVLRGVVRRDSGDLEGAKQDAQTALKMNGGQVHSPEHMGALELLVTLQMAQRDWSTAEATANRIKAASPGGASGYYLSGLINQAQQEYALSIEEFERALQITPDSIDSLLALAKSYLAQDKSADALRLLKQVLNHAPANAKAHNMMGVVLAREKEHSEAEAKFRKATALDPKSVIAYRNLGRAHWGRGDTGGAIRVYREGLEKTSRASPLAYELAVRYEQLGEPDLAISEYDGILSKDPKYGAAANNLAMLLATHKEDSKNLDRAMQLAKRFRLSKHPELLDTLGWVHYKRGELDEALLFLKQAVRVSPDVPEMRYHLGMAYQSKGEIALARRQLATALRSNVNFRGIEEARRTLQMLTAH